MVVATALALLALGVVLGLGGWDFTLGNLPVWRRATRTFLGQENRQADPVGDATARFEVPFNASEVKHVRSYLAIKRALDLSLSITLLLVFAPVLLVCAVIVAVASGRPILYAHQRVGLHGHPFRMWKFRTMAADAEAQLDAHLAVNGSWADEYNHFHKLRADPRVTTVGRFLRRWSLDETPQLFNVACGSMSLVGPRPITYDELALYPQARRYYYSVRPGLTGWWQTSGRSDLPLSERVRLDCQYVSGACLRLDIWLMLRTPKAVVRGIGAR